MTRSRSVRDDAFGGVVVFLGTVRSRSRGKGILHLEYEAYAEMAEAKMREIAERLTREHGPLRIAMHHRSATSGSATSQSSSPRLLRTVTPRSPRHGPRSTSSSRSCHLKKEHTEDGAIWIEEHA